MKNERYELEKELGRKLDLRRKDDKEKFYFYHRKKVMARENKVFEDFSKNANLLRQTKIYDGYEMVETFHEFYSKYDSIINIKSDDCGNITYNDHIYHVGGDDIIVYIMTNNPCDCQVRFNNSVYLF